MKHFLAIILFFIDPKFRRLLLAKLSQHGADDTVSTGETIVPVLRKETGNNDLPA